MAHSATQAAASPSSRRYRQSAATSLGVARPIPRNRHHRAGSGSSCTSATATRMIAAPSTDSISAAIASRRVSRSCSFGDVGSAWKLTVSCRANLLHRPIPIQVRRSSRHPHSRCSCVMFSFSMMPATVRNWSSFQRWRREWRMQQRHKGSASCRPPSRCHQCHGQHQDYASHRWGRDQADDA